MNHMSSSQRKVLKQFAKMGNFERKLTTWENWIDRLARRLRKGISIQESESFYKRMQASNITRMMIAISELTQQTKLNNQSATCVETIVSSIESLVFWTGQAESRETSDKVLKLLIQQFRTSSEVSRKDIQRLEVDLNKIKTRFHQQTDPILHNLFLKATYRHADSLGTSKLKRGYTFGQALQDENAEGKHLPEMELSQHFQKFVFHYKTWRSRNKTLVSSIHGGNAVVT